MLNNPPTPIVQTVATPAVCSYLPRLGWGAVLGGTVAAIGIHILLSMLGLAGGLATFSPATDADPMKHFDKGTAMIWSLCALVSLFFGSLLAGRFSQSWHEGFASGILVWSLTLITTLLLLSAGTGMVLGGGLKVLGEAMNGGSKAASAAVGDLVQDAATRNGNELKSFVEEASLSVPTNAAPKAAIRAKREVGLAAARLFAPGNDINSQDNCAAVIRALEDYTQMNETDATATVDGWINSYKSLQAELQRAKAAAEQAAREKAEQAARTLSRAATWSFFALLIGLLVSAFGGTCGALCAVRHMNSRIDTTRY
jgi:hypothetical protein